MLADDFAYWSRRAEQHTIQAIGAVTLIAAEVHQDLAARYMSRALERPGRRRSA